MNAVPRTLFGFAYLLGLASSSEGEQTKAETSDGSRLWNALECDSAERTACDGVVAERGGVAEVGSTDELGDDGESAGLVVQIADSEAEAWDRVERDVVRTGSSKRCQSGVHSRNSGGADLDSVEECSDFKSNVVAVTACETKTVQSAAKGTCGVAKVNGRGSRCRVAWEVEDPVICRGVEINDW